MSGASSWRPGARTRGSSTASRRRSCRTTTRARAGARCAGSTSRRTPARASSCAAPAGRCSTSSSTSGAARRPSASGSRSSSTTSTAASCGSRSASGTASACSRRPPTSSTSARTTTTAPRRRASASTTPTSGSSGRTGFELLYSQRDRDGAAAGRGRRLAAVLGVSDGRFAPSPTGDAAPREPAHRAARVAVRALGGLAVPGADGGPRHGPRAAGGGRGAARRPAPRSGWTGTGRWCTSRSRLGLYAAALERLRGERRLYECYCTRAEIREAASAAHGPLPEGAYPGTCLRLSAAELAEKRASGRPPALRVRADGARVAFDGPAAGADRGRRGRLRRAPRRRRVRLQPRRRRRRRRPGRRGGRARARTWPTPPRASSGWRGRSGCRSPSYAHVPLVLGPDGRAAGQAPRRRDAARGAAGRGAGVDGVLAGVLGRRARRSGWRSSTRPASRRAPTPIFVRLELLFDAGDLVGGPLVGVAGHVEALLGLVGRVARGLEAALELAALGLLALALGLLAGPLGGLALLLLALALGGRGLALSPAWRGAERRFFGRRRRRHERARGPGAAGRGLLHQPPASNAVRTSSSPATASSSARRRSLRSRERSRSCSASFSSASTAARWAAVASRSASRPPPPSWASRTASPAARKSSAPARPSWLATQATWRRLRELGDLGRGLLLAVLAQRLGGRVALRDEVLERQAVEPVRRLFDRISRHRRRCGRARRRPASRGSCRAS